MLPALVVESRVLENVYARLAVRPGEYRLVTLTCRGSYQEFPSGAHSWPIPLNCGYGRKLWSTVPLAGKFAYGALKPAWTAAGELMADVNKVRVLAFVRSPSPTLRRTSGLTAL